MQLLRKSSIGRRLTKVVLFTSLLGLGIACATFQLYERVNFRRALTEELTALADTVGSNSAAPILFEDQKAALDLLSGLAAEPHIIAATLYNKEGIDFADYQRPGSRRPPRVAFHEEEGEQFTEESLTLRRKILFQGDKIGVIDIVYDLEAFHAKMRQYTIISIVVLLYSFLMTLVVSSRLLRPITEPIRALAGVAAKVSKDEDYSLRAVAQNEDEVGELVHSFNGMLERIQERDRALQEAKDELELRVELRTSELKAEVNERKQAEVKLQASLKDLEDMKFAMDQHSIVARTDARGVITFVNENFCTVSKYGPEELIGQTHNIVNSKHHPPEFFAELWRTVSSGQVWRGEVKNRAKDGSYYWVNTTVVPFCDARGKPTQYIAIRMDITNLKMIEEELRRAKDVAEQASRAKSEFLANMSHEIRTPLNGIMGMTDLALDTQLTPEQREYLETVKNSSDSLLTVINDILDFSKIEAGKMDLECADFAVRDVVESTLRTLAVRADGKGLELACELDAGVPELVRGDAARLRQVLTNLAGNAIKFTDRGEVVVKVVKEDAADGGVMVHFTVSDSGVGIIASKLKMIFDPFSQADTSTTRKYGGTGLGLTISARLVEMMGGKIWVESEVGRGSQFHFTARVEVGTRGAGEGKYAGMPESLKGLRVLIVDDNRANRRVLEAMLRTWGMEPASAESGEQALEKLEKAVGAGATFPLVLTDMHMPMMDGFELVERMRQRLGLAAATILMLTSGGGRGDLERCKSLGVSAYLVKPVRRAELRDAITRAMGGRGDETRQEAAKISQRKAHDSWEPLRVLVAEDNAVNQRLILRMLEKLGHSVTVTSNGREAAQAAERESFDLVFMDVQMPEVDGFEATAMIRTREKSSGGHLPIVALTAHAMKGDREKCLAGGMDDYLTKPIQPKELHEILQKYAAKVHVKV